MRNNDQHSNAVTSKAGRGVIGPVLRRTAAAAALTLLVAGCSSGAGSAGSSSAASLTSGETSAPPATTVVGGNSATATTKTLGETTASPTSTPASAVSSTGSLVAEAVLANPAGVQVGTVDFAVDGTVVTVTAQVDGLPPGFKGFHIHAIGKCEPNSANPTDPSKVGDFLSAGGHLGAAGAAHPGHQGDLSSLQVRADGSAELVTTTDAFDMNAVLDADGSAVMVHVGPDNFGNIPTRYAPSGPDADTQATGDSGGRGACGVVKAVGG